MLSFLWCGVCLEGFKCFGVEGFRLLGFGVLGFGARSCVLGLESLGSEIQRAL